MFNEFFLFFFFFHYSCTASGGEDVAKLSHLQLTEEIVFPSISANVIRHKTLCVFLKNSQNFQGICIADPSKSEHTALYQILAKLWNTIKK